MKKFSELYGNDKIGELQKFSQEIDDHKRCVESILKIMNPLNFINILNKDVLEIIKLSSHISSKNNSLNIRIEFFDIVSLRAEEKDKRFASNVTKELCYIAPKSDEIYQKIKIDFSCMPGIVNKDKSIVKFYRTSSMKKNINLYWIYLKKLNGPVMRFYP